MLSVQNFWECENTVRPEFDGIITDPPYKNSFASNSPVGDLGDTAYSNEAFVKRAGELIRKNGFLIVFGNFVNISEIYLLAREGGWKYSGSQVWDKTPTRTWISWSRPLRHTEHILYLVRGKTKLDFRNGEVKEAVKRSSFGGELKAQGTKENKASYGMYQDVVDFPVPRKQERVHPTQKPVEFSYMFRRIVGDDKRVLDPFCGSGALIQAFPYGAGYDLEEWWEKCKQT